MRVLGEFKKFAMRGSIVDLAIGFTVGAAFNSIAQSLVDDILMPPIGLLLGNTDFANLFLVLQEGAETAAPYATIADAQAAGAVTWNYGSFINNVVAFLIVAMAMFVLVRSLNRIEEELDEHFGEEEATPEGPLYKKCRYCWSTIAHRASRCPNCTSELSPAGPQIPVAE